MKLSPVHRIAVPNPFFEGQNSVYLIAGDPVTLIDTGVATDKAFAALVAGLKQHGIDMSDVQRVILTHKHIDHIGNAWRFCESANAEVFIHEADLSDVVDVDASGERFADEAIGRLRDWDVPESRLPSRTTLPPWKIESIEAIPLTDGQMLPMGGGELQVLHTPGHTMGSICLRYGDRLLTGDHVLPDISSNVGGGDLRCDDLLSHFLRSLQTVAALNDVAWALPGHGEPFQAVRERCEELIQHHDHRLQAIVDVLKDGPLSIYDIAFRLFGEMQGIHVVLGCAEAHSHLELLVQQGRVVAEKGLYSQVD